MIALMPPSEYIARIAYRKYFRVRARGRQLRAVFSKPSPESTPTEAVDPITAQQKEDAAVELIATVATHFGGSPYVLLDRMLEAAAQRRASGDESLQRKASGRERRG